MLRLGQLICAYAQTFTLFIPTKFAFAWFPEHQRTLANSVCFAANFLGVFIGTVLPPIIVSRSDQVPLLVRFEKRFVNEMNRFLIFSYI